jgi:CheY-like chemotaxis protein
MPSPVRRVLYVEDEEDDVHFLKRALNAVCPSIEIDVANDGVEAIEFLSNHQPRPDWVILDLKMPRKSGLEVLEWIRAHPTLKDLRVTVLSSSPEQSDIARVEKLGIDGYIVKPVNYAGLLEVVSRLAGRWGVPTEPMAGG